MKASSYLSLARNYSFVIILLVLLALQGTETYSAKMWQITKARTLFTDLIIESTDWEAPLITEPSYLVKLEGVDEPVRYEILSRREVEVQNELPVPSVPDVEYRFRIRYEGSPRWVSLPQSVTLKAPGSGAQDEEGTPATEPEKDAPRSWRALPKLRELERNIFRTSTVTSSEPVEGVTKGAALRDADLIRKKIEADALEKRITIPGIGLEFANKVAPWFIALAVLGLIAQIRNQVRRTFLDPKLAIDEPWLILDARRGLEKAVAACWVFAIFISPWIVTGCLIAVSTAEGMADGWGTAIGSEIVFTLSLVALLLLGGWSSLTVTGELLRLRRLRLGLLGPLIAQGHPS